MRRCSRAAVIPADQNDVGSAFGDAGRDGADAHFGYEFDVNACSRVGVLQIIDQLSQILDRIDVMMRRRRNEADPRRGTAHFGYPRVHFTSGQLPAFARLGALRHLDLDFVGIHQVMRRDAESARRNLLDGAAAGIAVRIRNVTRGIFPAFAVLLLPPMRFIAIARLSCASLLIEPKDIAPVLKRRMMDSTGSTSSSGTAGPAYFSFSMERMVIRCSFSPCTSLAYFLYTW